MICIHDGIRDHHEAYTTTNLQQSVTTYECGALLYSWERKSSEIKSRKFIHDEVYELIYTRKGRMKLVKEALEARGWPIPDFWQDD